MFDNNNIYKLRAETAGGITRHYVSFRDGVGRDCEVEVARHIYSEFLRFAKSERSLRHWDERHREYAEITDTMLRMRALNKPKSLEETILDNLRNETLRLAIRRLPEIQRRRLLLYHEFGLSLKQIANIEGCSPASVSIAIKRARSKIKEAIKKFEDEV